MLPDSAPLDVIGVQQLIARFANCFDARDWKGLGACLADKLYTDYSALRGTPPQTVTREQFVESRRLALDALETQHLCGNVEVRPSGGECEARASMVIFRRDRDGRVLNTHCLYTFGVGRRGAGWEICSITQKVFWSEGQKSIHPGIVAGDA